MDLEKNVSKLLERSANDSKTLDKIELRLSRIEERLEGDYVTRKELASELSLINEKYTLSRNIIYGTVSLITITFVTTVIAFFIKKP